MKTFLQVYTRFWPVISLILIAVLFMFGSLSFFQAMVLLILTIISTQLDRLLVQQEAKRQYSEFLVRAMQRSENQ
ncbi:hypothetical protein ACFQ38_00315 [Sporosarcina contaminans]|uniref:Uncharacterized protein n=1 Tax=Sporosarcina contaminans TaxID=633403 RepID=A0ABW3TSH7_9BACL